MTRALLCGLLLAGAAVTSRAGELDKEGAKPTPSPLTVAPAAKAGTELDGESPLAAHRWRGYYGGYGWGRPAYGFGFSYYGGGYRPWYGGFGYPGFYGGYRSYSFSNYYGGWNGWGGGWGGYYAYRPYYSSFYFGGPAYGCWW
jgi:hypothetical protein